MKQLLQFFLLGLVAAGLLAPTCPAVAQTAGDPAVVVSMANLDEQLKDIQYVMDKAGQGPMFGMVSAQANQFLNGLDRSKPMGALLYFSEESPEPKWMALLPVKNLDDVLDTISQFAEVEENGEVTEITPQGGGQTMFVREADGYAVVSDDGEMLEMAPSNPGEILAGVSSAFNVGARLYVQRIPEGMREMAISAMEDGYRQQMEAMDDEDLAELQQQNFDMQMARMKSLINETEELLVGLNIDKETKSVHFDMQMVGKSGSELARQSEAYSSAAASRFGGFYDQAAAMSMSFSGKVSPTDAEQANQGLDSIVKLAISKMEEEGMGDSEKELFSGVVTDLVDVLKKTMAEGNMDMAAKAVLDDSNANLLAAVQLADPKKVEQSVKDVVAAAKGQVGDEAEFNLDMGKHDGVQLHEIIGKVADEKGQALLGSDSVKIYLGIGDKAVYLAAGNDPLDALKTAISAGSGSSDEAPMRVNLRLASVLKKLASMEDEQMLQAFADKLSSSGRDRVGFMVKAITNGLEMKLEAEDGILELIGVAIANQMGGGGDF